MNTLPPADKVQQVVSVNAQGGVSQAADIFAIQVTIDPANLPARRLFDHANRALSAVGGLLVDHVELHGCAASRRDWNCRASPPWTKKEFGSWPSGSTMRRAVMPCARRRCANRSDACWPLPLASTSKVR